MCPAVPGDPIEDFSGLVARAAGGDRDALGRIWRAEHPSLLRYLRVRVGDRLAEDVASAVWVDVARSLGRFHGGREEFRRWLFTIGRRRSIDELRRIGRRAEHLSARPAEVPSCGDDTAGIDGLDAALQLVARLTDDQAEAVLLRVVADFDVATVAQLMGRSEPAIRALTHRGLHRLAELVGEPSPIEGNPPGAVTAEAAPTMEGTR